MTTATAQAGSVANARGGAFPRAHLLAAALLVAGAVAATWPVWVGIFRYAASSEEQSHSFIALPVAALLVWVRRGRLGGAGARPRWSWLGPVVMAAGWGLAAAGFRTSTDMAMHLGSLLLVVGAAYTALGWLVLGRVLPAVFALALVLPVPGRVRLAVAGPLQEWSAQISQFLLDLFGFAVHRSGNVLSLNGVEVTIAEACNGMRMVSALAVIAYAFVFTSPLRPAARAGILLFSPVIALGVNVLRLIPTVLIYGYSDRHTAELFHDVSGWGVLLLAIGILFGITGLLRWLEVPIGRTAGDVGPAAPVLPPAPARRGWPAALAAAAVLAGTAALGGFQARPPPGLEGYHARVAAAILAVPYRIGGAVGIDQDVSPGAVRILNPTAMIQRRYTDPETGAAFGLIVIHSADARDLIGHYPPACYPAHGWLPRGAAAATYCAGPLCTPATLYGFTRRNELGEAGVRVVSFFALPAGGGEGGEGGGGRGGGGLAADMDAVVAASRSTTMTALGAAHFLVSFAAEASDEQVRATLGMVLEQLEPTLRTVGGGVSR